MKKTIKLTEKRLAELKMKWYEMGKRQGLKEFKRELAEKLGLYDIFEIIKEDY